MSPQPKKKKPRRANLAIDEGKHKEIIAVFNETLKAYNRQNDEQDESLTISFTKKALKKLKITGVKSSDITSFFKGDKRSVEIDKVDADMFMRFAAEKVIQLEKSNRAFQLIDGGKKGVVVIDDLRRICDELQESITEDELIEMIEFADTAASKDGILTPDDFFRIANKVNL